MPSLKLHLKMHKASSKGNRTFHMLTCSSYHLNYFLSFFTQDVSGGGTSMNFKQFFTFDFVISSLLAISTLLSLPLVSFEVKDDFSAEPVSHCENSKKRTPFFDLSARHSNQRMEYVFLLFSNTRRKQQKKILKQVFKKIYWEWCWWCCTHMCSWLQVETLFQLALHGELFSRWSPSHFTVSGSIKWTKVQMSLDISSMTKVCECTSSLLAWFKWFRVKQETLNFVKVSLFINIGIVYSSSLGSAAGSAAGICSSSIGVLGSMLSAGRGLQEKIIVTYCCRASC